MHRALKDKCSNLCASMIVSLMPQDPLCINSKQIPADFQPGSGQIQRTKYKIISYQWEK